MASSRRATKLNRQASREKAVRTLGQCTSWGPELLPQALPTASSQPGPRGTAQAVGRAVSRAECEHTACAPGSRGTCRRPRARGSTRLSHKGTGPCKALLRLLDMRAPPMSPGHTPPPGAENRLRGQVEARRCQTIQAATSALNSNS